MTRRPISEPATIDVERQARYRAARAADRLAVVLTRRPADHHSRAKWWYDATAELTEPQTKYQT